MLSSLEVKLLVIPACQKSKQNFKKKKKRYAPLLLKFLFNQTLSVGTLDFCFNKLSRWFPYNQSELCLKTTGLDQSFFSSNFYHFMNRKFVPSSLVSLSIYVQNLSHFILISLFSWSSTSLPTPTFKQRLKQN